MSEQSERRGKGCGLILMMPASAERIKGRGRAVIPLADSPG